MGADGGSAPHHSKKHSRAHEDTDAEYAEKYNKYAAEYVRRLKAKYFSKNSFDGGIIFDKETVVDNEIIRASKGISTKSFAEAPCMGDEHKSSTSAADPSANASARKLQSRKNS